MVAPRVPIDLQDHSHSHSHSHSHTHDHGHGNVEIGEGTTTAARRFGIDNFVYRQRRPFHPERLGRILKVSFVFFTRLFECSLGYKIRDYKEGCCPKTFGNKLLFDCFYV